MRVRFTRHAERKLEDLAEQGFLISREQIESALHSPERILKAERNRLIAQRTLDETHVLRVIYEEADDLITVITFYPARRRRYEGQV